MLVLSRKVGQRIKVGDDIYITVVRVSGDKCRLGIEAPPDVIVLRDELTKDEGADAAAATTGSDKETKTDVSSEVPTG